MIRVKQGVRLEFAAENQVSFNSYDYDIGEETDVNYRAERRDVIIKDKAQNTLHQYQLEGCIYKEGWSENLPPGVNTASIIAVYSYGSGYKLLLQDKSTSTTLEFSPASRKLDSWHYEGILLTCLSITWRSSIYPVYAVEKTEGEYEIVIFSIGDIEMILEKRLRPVTAKLTWSHPYLSVCGNETERRIAVTSSDRSLDICYWEFGK